LADPTEFDSSTSAALRRWRALQSRNESGSTAQTARPRSPRGADLARRQSFAGRARRFRLVCVNGRVKARRQSGRSSEGHEVGSGALAIQQPEKAQAMTTSVVQPPSVANKLLWVAVASLGAVSFAVVALWRGESVNAAWLVIAAVCIYLIAYRFYALFITRYAFGVDPQRPTPAYRRNDGLDYVPTDRYVLFGRHFAAIAGAGPLVGGRCSPRKWATCRARCGSSPASSSPARSRT
jgi:hypothetical protein